MLPDYLVLHLYPSSSERLAPCLRDLRSEEKGMFHSVPTWHGLCLANGKPCDESSGPLVSLYCEARLYYVQGLLGEPARPSLCKCYFRVEILGR